jgi:leucyl/phenylalanyl-tRNA---protein transferase
MCRIAVTCRTSPRVDNHHGNQYDEPRLNRPRWLTSADAADSFPPLENSLTEPDGLLAIGGDLSPPRLLAAYKQGIFPWYEEGQPILWWSPNPRAVLLPENLHIPRRLRRTRRQSRFQYSCDQSFAAVIEECSGPRRYADGTWITAEMNVAYNALHKLGWAHSFEVWQSDELVGGIYGIAIGNVFFGESMFSKVTDASKLALVTAVEFLRDRKFTLLDCQVWSAHLQTLGATMLPRAEFVHRLRHLCEPTGALGPWSTDFARYLGDDQMPPDS